MRTLFSLAALLAVLAVVALLATKQLSAATLPSVPPPAAESPAQTPPPLRGTPQQQLDQFRQGLNEALQQAPRKIDE
jgi:cytochrome c-type biogenesis protein CcmH/NrfG